MAKAGAGLLALHLGAIATSAALIAVAAPGIGGRVWLAPLAFAPWFAVLRGLKPVVACLCGLVMGLAYIVPGRWDTFAAGIAADGHTGFTQWLALWAFFAAFALPFALFGFVDAWLQRRLDTPATLTAPLRASVLASLICGLWSPFPYTPAAMLMDWPALLQPAALGGEVLILTLLLWPSAAVAALLHQPWNTHRTLALLAPVTLIWLTAWLWGNQRLQAFDAAQARGEGQQLAALPLQLDLPTGAQATELTRDRPNVVRSALELTRAGLAQAPRCELAVWPETSLDINQTKIACSQASAMAKSLGLPLLLQCNHPEQDRWLVTAEFLQPNARNEWGDVKWHAKSALVPFYEQPIFGGGPLLRGEYGTVFTLDAGRRILPALCYELHSRNHVRAGVLNGANVVAHMASFSAFARHPIDIWDTGLARIRAVEFGIPILRAANRGPVGWIDSGGRAHSVGERLGRHSQCLDVWLPDRTPTLHTWIAPVAPWLPGLFALALAWGWRRRQPIV